MIIAESAEVSLQVMEHRSRSLRIKLDELRKLQAVQQHTWASIAAAIDMNPGSLRNALSKGRMDEPFVIRLAEFLSVDVRQIAEVREVGDHARAARSKEGDLLLKTFRPHELQAQLEGRPRIAQLALAVRVALRLELVFLRSATDIRAERRELVSAAIGAARAVATGTDFDVRALSQIHEDARDVSRDAAKMAHSEGPARRASVCAVFAARVACRVGGTEPLAEDVVRSVASAEVAVNGHPSAEAALVSDVRRALRLKGTDRGIKAYLRSDLWPDGPPDEWPECVIERF